MVCQISILFQYSMNTSCKIKHTQTNQNYKFFMGHGSIQNQNHVYITHYLLFILKYDHLIILKSWCWHPMVQKPIKHEKYCNNLIPSKFSEIKLLKKSVNRFYDQGQLRSAWCLAWLIMQDIDGVYVIYRLNEEGLNLHIRSGY